MVWFKTCFTNPFVVFCFCFASGMIRKKKNSDITLKLEQTRYDYITMLIASGYRRCIQGFRSGDAIYFGEKSYRFEIYIHG